ncbi:hypothetical protein [Natrinema sp. 1APR25-10V2]|uniref:hypothetical protein n=1 Tax=Natrinema sp. 1APR25-10V2 TaxID=2951081 RepID=UPI0028763C84|nr:hypothetical protein [Natrinema sp. 1APR25-10V2]MDS0476190.1 hypothetical protein [Natrinema sp. 1APR25-10V2]
MPKPLSAMLAVLAVVLFLLALTAMYVEALLLAGLCFIGLSLVIYLRETRA